MSVNGAIWPTERDVPKLAPLEPGTTRLWQHVRELLGGTNGWTGGPAKVGG
jgi:hypothetical protein